MSKMSDYTEQKFLDHALGTTAWTAPTNVYLALFSSDPTDAGSGTELTVTLGYARAVMSFNAATSPGGLATIDTEIVFTNSGGGDWAAATHVGVFDASTVGNLLFHGALAATRTVLDGGTLTFAATTGITITAA